MELKLTVLMAIGCPGMDFTEEFGTLMKMVKHLDHGDLKIATFGELGKMMNTIHPSNMTTLLSKKNAKTPKMITEMPTMLVVNTTREVAGNLSVMPWTVTKASKQERCAVFAMAVQLTNQSQPLV
jgi:hypothetical protein